MLAILPTPAKPDGAGSKNTGYSGHTVPSGLNREESETEKDAETGGGFTIISMGKIESDEIKKEAKL